MEFKTEWVPPNGAIKIDDGSPYEDIWAKDNSRKGVPYFLFPDDATRIYLDNKANDWCKGALEKWRSIIAAVAIEEWIAQLDIWNEEIKPLSWDCSPEENARITELSNKIGAAEEAIDAIRHWRSQGGK